MIDDKKIEAAANKHIETEYARYNSGEVEEEMICHRGKDSFKAGAKWMQEEFLKNLLHPASEEPDKHRICLVRVVYHLNCGMLPDEERIEQSSFHDFGWYDYDFKYIGVDYDIVSYLYVDELLPKKGGNHD